MQQHYYQGVLVLNAHLSLDHSLMSQSWRRIPDDVHLHDNGTNDSQVMS